MIAPIENERTLYVRVKSWDSTTSQTSIDSQDLAAIAVTPHSTKTLAEALGSANSCGSLDSASDPLEQKPMNYLLFLGFGFSCLVLRLGFRKKLGPAHLEIGGEGIEI